MSTKSRTIFDTGFANSPIPRTHTTTPPNRGESGCTSAQIFSRLGVPLHSTTTGIHLCLSADGETA